MSPKKYNSKIAKFILANNAGGPVSNLADQIGISQSYLSEILNGKKDPSIEVCNKIADFFGVPRIKVYIMMGWIEEVEVKKELQYYVELVRKDPNFKELADLYNTFDSIEDQKRAVRVLKSLLEDKIK